MFVDRLARVKVSIGVSPAGGFFYQPITILHS
jgi:hypothetical protein